MQWSNYKFNSPFSKLPLFVCTLLMTLNAQNLLASTQEIPSTLEVKSEEEAFLVRRIAEFWKDRDYVLVKRQIHTFLEKFPTSPINDQLRGILGDLYLQDKKYKEALEAYSKISDPYIEEKVIVNRLQCYYELSDYASLAKEGKPYLHLNSKRLGERKDELNFLVAEAYFRQALEAGDPTIRQDFAAQARSLYESVVNTSFSKHSKLALAEVYHILKQHDKAAAYYIEIANAYPDQKEELLSQAALAQAEYDPQLAIITFTEVIQMKGKKLNDASINRLILFFQEEEYDNVVKYYPEIALSVNDEKKTTLDYIMGRSYFALQDYKTGSEYLGKYIAIQSGSSPQLKNALLMQLNCAQQCKNDDLSDRSIALFRQHFSQDKEFGQALFIHAMMLKGRGDLAGAEVELAQIMTEGKYDDKQSLFLEYGLVTHENEKWSESYVTLKSYLSMFQKSENAPIAWKYFLSSSLNRLKEIDSKNDGYTKAQFYDDLTLVLNEQSATKSILSQEEERDCRLLSGKTAYELRRFPVAIKQLDSYIKDFPTDKNVGEAHLLAGICHQNLDSDPELFYSNIEKAISFSPDLANQASLHLQLYNAYLTKIDLITQQVNPKNINPHVKPALYELAAEHLYKAISLGDTNVKSDNKLWLANHYYQKTKASDSRVAANQENVKRSYDLFRSLLTLNSTTDLVMLTKDNISLESEVLKYADLLTIRNQQDVKISVLKNLAEQQTKNHHLGWTYQMQTLLELAQTYEALKDDENALDTYTFITKASAGVPSYISDYAMLHGNRIRFNLIEPDFKNDRNEQVLTMLNQLKDLQIKKSISSEPLHLEAALAYAKMRSELAPESEREEKYLFFLGRVKEDYLSSDDPVVREYHKRLATSPDKQVLYESYMTFVDAEVLRTKGKIEYRKNRLSQAEEFNSAALSKLAEIKSSDKLTTYLNENVQISIQQIDQINHF